MARAHVQTRNPIHNAPRTSAPFATDSALAASVTERRTMKKVAQPEHAYTGCVPQRDEPEMEELPVKRNPPILGYKGHLRNAQDWIGTTFTNGLEAATRPAESVGYRGANNQRNASGRLCVEATRERQPNPQVRFQVPLPQPGRPGNGDALKDKPQAQMSPRSKYEAFENASGYGEFLAKPQMSEQSGYGEFENASGYGEFLEKPGAVSKRSGYGAFDNASGYGEFQAKPPEMSPRSAYGGFDNVSGYGEFQRPPTMSKRSGYGAFDNASGYGEFQKPPTMSKRSGYGAFDNASGYGEFQKPPTMSKRSGYGAFDNASGYGEFREPPLPQMSARSGYGVFEGASGYGEFAAPPVSRSLAYGAFDGASGYGEFMEAPNQEVQFDSPSSKEDYHASPGPTTLVLKYSESLGKKYQQAMKAVGGKTNVLRLWHAAAVTISCRYRKRTELLQSIRRSFEKRESENGGRMTKEHLKEALQSLACVFTDDQVTALFGLYDAQCKVFSQGNSGRNGCATAGSPGDYPNVIGVGATNSADALADFSGKGPTLITNRRKPDISAPGRSVRAASNETDSSYMTISGTSMAAPHVTGAVALLLSAQPEFSIDEVKVALYTTTDQKGLAPSNYTCGGTSDLAWPNNQWGHGRLNVLNAYEGFRPAPSN